MMSSPWIRSKTDRGIFQWLHTRHSCPLTEWFRNASLHCQCPRQPGAPCIRVDFQGLAAYKLTRSWQYTSRNDDSTRPSHRWLVWSRYRTTWPISLKSVYTTDWLFNRKPLYYSWQFTTAWNCRLGKYMYHPGSANTQIYNGKSSKMVQTMLADP